MPPRCKPGVDTADSLSTIPPVWWPVLTHSSEAHFSWKLEKKKKKSPGFTQVQWAKVYQKYRVLSCSVASVKSDTLRPRGTYSPPASSVHGIHQAITLEFTPFWNEQSRRYKTSLAWCRCWWEKNSTFLYLHERWLGGWARRQNVFSGPSFMLLKLVNVVIKKGSTPLPLLNAP